jgi:hypothetical protein
MARSKNLTGVIGEAGPIKKKGTEGKGDREDKD